MTPKYLIRLDDAARYMNIENWKRIEFILDKYNIKPMVGVIPNCKDSSLFYDRSFTDEKLWELVKRWEEKGWIIGMHGYEHLYFITDKWRYVPIWNKTEFASLPLQDQRKKIRSAYDIFIQNGIKPRIFIAPSHTFDKNTLKALLLETDIRIISDCFAFDVFHEEEFFFIPQQLWSFKRMFFGLWTICLHPNTLKDQDFEILEKNLERFYPFVISLNDVKLKKRKWSFIEKFINFHLWYNNIPKIKRIISFAK